MENSCYFQVSRGDFSTENSGGKSGAVPSCRMAKFLLVFSQAVAWTFLWVGAGLSAASPKDAGPQLFFEEETMRYLTLTKSDGGNTRVIVRFAWDPGSMATWEGFGTRQDKILSFARLVGEVEDRGTFFQAEISESRVVVDYKPGQKQPQDAGINGTYRRVSETKAGQLAKKEFQAANERLIAALKLATKAWAPGDRAALTLWREEWPVMRQHWVDLVAGQAGGAATGAVKVAGVKAAEPTAEVWLAMAQATARGYSFVEGAPDPKTGLGWDGEYDDLGGGHVSLRQGKDGRLRATLTSAREPGVEASLLESTVPADRVKTGKGGELTAEFTYSDPDAVVKHPPVRVRLMKLGRYLRVETEAARPYAGNGWFDGIYRGAPVPPEG